MSPETKTSSKVPPLLLAALVCDVAVTDPSTGKNNLIGIFDRIHAKQVPASRAMSIYIKLTDAIGTYPTRVDFMFSNSERLIARLEGEVASDDPKRTMESHFEFPPLPLPDFGHYEFRIYASEMFLGSASLDVVQQE